MGAKNVALRAEVVELLDREKKPGESYSDVVLRLAAQRRPLLSLVEALEAMTPDPDDELDRRVREIRQRSRRDPVRRADL